MNKRKGFLIGTVIFGIIFLSMAFGMLITIIGLPKICLDTFLYSEERINYGCGLLFGVVLFLGLMLYFLYTKLNDTK